ncbi:MAG: leucine-rich repeat domain-containing protein [Lachnospiraceae bacterium]|nr:leucine-rich repeat domain-containing protein [Lachnospiraceae bacterium]
MRDNASKAVYKVVDAKVVNGKVTGSVAYAKPTQTSFKSVSIPSSVTINGGTYQVTSIAEKAFQNNRKLTKVTIGGNITSIGANAFHGCTKLKTVTIGKNVTSIGNSAFRKCSSLTKLTIPAKVKKIGKQAFSGCKKLKNITIKTTKLTKKSVGSKAFQEISAKAVIKVPKKQLKTYRSILKVRGIGKKVKIRK